MAWVWNVINRVPWGGVANGAYQAGAFLGGVATAGMQGTWAFFSTLPRDCYQATVHTALVCHGSTPQYEMIPGFGPIALGWGWMVLGAGLGFITGITLVIIIMVVWKCVRGGPPGENRSVNFAVVQSNFDMLIFFTTPNPKG